VTLARVRHAKSSFPGDPNRDTLGQAYKGAVYLVGEILLQVTCSRQKEIVMGDRFSGSILTVAIAAAIASAGISLSVTRTSAQAPAVSGAALKTPWGEPDLQGIWTDEFDTPLQRSAKYANQEFFTEAQRADLDKARSAILTRFATEREINGAYNAATFFSTKRTGERTSKIVDPPNGRFPPLTPEAQKMAAAEREFRVALLQSTETCKNKEAACNGGKYDPAQSSRFAGQRVARRLRMVFTGEKATPFMIYRRHH